MARAIFLYRNHFVIYNSCLAIFLLLYLKIEIHSLLYAAFLAEGKKPQQLEYTPTALKREAGCLSHLHLRRFMQGFPRATPQMLQTQLIIDLYPILYQVR